ncbi:hypothetical protein NDU88_003374 [Pleurodeles waltl]|uniref:Uncharacterized protein n=1 Tax=Pleurodeles waltl TaxID=8319 RepID=A0AAV7W782_PLEWA|nr:hypothetical protein NDU88_003374 [Pleurodeles waltl]
MSTVLGHQMVLDTKVAILEVMDQGEGNNSTKTLVDISFMLVKHEIAKRWTCALPPTVAEWRKGTQAAASSGGLARDEENASRRLTVRGAPPSAPAAATTGGGFEWPTPHPPAPASGDRSPLGLRGAEDGAQIRGGKAATRNRGEARRWRRTSFLLGHRGRRASLCSPAGPDSIPPPNLAENRRPCTCGLVVRCAIAETCERGKQNK